MLDSNYIQNIDPLSFKILILSGGIGGAKLVEGFYHSEQIKRNQIAIISNNGDDIYRYGLRICPDIDILIYTLADVVNHNFLWGLEDDSYITLNSLKKFYGENTDWFHIGDKDFATHIFRTDLLNKGMDLTHVTLNLADKFNIKSLILPMSNEYTPTYIHTFDNRMHFEEYLVKYGAKSSIKSIEYGGIHLEQLKYQKILSTLFKNVEKIIIGPSNPFMSIAPIISIPFYEKLLSKYKKKVIAISPLIGGKAIKGPLEMNLKNLGYEVNSFGIALFYKKYISSMVIDPKDIEMNNDIEEKIRRLGINCQIFDILLNNVEKKIKLANSLLI